VQADDVAGGDQLIDRQADGLQFAACGLLHRMLARVGDPHTERLASPGHGGADLTRADEADLHPLDGVAEHEGGAIAPRCAGPDQAFGLTEAPGDHQQQTECGVGGGVEQHPGGRRGHDAALLAQLEIDVVESGGDIGHHLELRSRSVQELPVHPVGEHAQHGVGAADLGEQLGARGWLFAGPTADLVAGGAQFVKTRLGNGVGNANLSHDSSPRMMMQPRAGG